MKDSHQILDNAYQHLEKKEIDKAETCLIDVIIKFPEEQDTISEAYNALNQHCPKYFSTLLSKITKGFTQDPENKKAQMVLINHFKHLPHKVEEAINIIELVDLYHETVPTKNRILLGAKILHLQYTTSFDAAFKEYHDALVLFPNSPRLKATYFTLLYRKQKYSEASKLIEDSFNDGSYDKLSKYISPTSLIEILHYLYVINQKANTLDKAIKYLKHALKTERAHELRAYSETSHKIRFAFFTQYGRTAEMLAELCSYNKYSHPMIAFAKSSEAPLINALLNSRVEVLDFTSQSIDLIPNILITVLKGNHFIKRVMLKIDDITMLSDIMLASNNVVEWNIRCKAETQSQYNNFCSIINNCLLSNKYILNVTSYTGILSKTMDERHTRYMSFRASVKDLSFKKVFHLKDDVLYWYEANYATELEQALNKRQVKREKEAFEDEIDFRIRYLVEAVIYCYTPVNDDIISAILTCFDRKATFATLDNHASTLAHAAKQHKVGIVYNT